MFYSVKLVAQSKAKPGQSIFTSSGTFTVPRGIKQIQVFAVGAGGCGAAQYDSLATGGGGGGYTVTQTIQCQPFQNISVSIGQSIAFQTSGSTTVGSICANAGSTSGFSNYDDGGKGGSGGGGGSRASGFTSCIGVAGRGGSDGSNGNEGYYTFPFDTSIHNSWGPGGKGQGSTTRAFGESWGTLYAGGGGGGCGVDGSNHSGGRGTGGDGGGGNGILIDNSYGFNGIDTGSGIKQWQTDGAANTGGGGGGGAGIGGHTICAAGGSGIAIIRWS